MTFFQAVVAIVVALITGTTGGGLVFAKFWIERKDKMEENSVQKRIDDAVLKAKTEMLTELTKVSKERSEEGAQRFNKHAASIDEINTQIQKNSIQIGELTELSKGVLESMNSLNKVVRASAESQRNSNYDRILVVANKVLKNRKITITEKTNLKQLYNSWCELHSEDEKLDPKITTIYDECMKLPPVPDEEG